MWKELDQRGYQEEGNKTGKRGKKRLVAKKYQGKSLLINRN